MTNSLESSAAKIIKRDRAGRVRYSREFRESVLAEFAQSGMSGVAFAAHCGLKYPTFAAWVAKEKRGKASLDREQSPQKFVLAELEDVGAAPDQDTSSGSAIRIVLPGGACAELASSSQIDLLSALLKSLA